MTRGEGVKLSHRECTFKCTGCAGYVEENYCLEITTKNGSRPMLLCFDCSEDLKHEVERDDQQESYTPRGEGEVKSGWFRVGRYDGPRRRALWVRVNETETVHVHGCAGIEEWESVEFCAGREGDDAYVKVLRDHPGFEDILDCALRSIDHLPGRYDDKWPELARVTELESAIEALSAESATPTGSKAHGQ